MKQNSQNDTLAIPYPDTEVVHHEDTTSNSLGLLFSIEYPRPTLGYATIIITPSFVDSVFHETALSQKPITHAPGFNRGEVPLEYIKQIFKENLLVHLKEFLFKYCVINFLYKQIREQKIMIAGDPRLLDIVTDEQNNIKYLFELSVFSDFVLHEWKYFPFKCPKRKNYKDLDRQVESFIEEERTQQESSSHEHINSGDWILFNLSLIKAETNELLTEQPQPFWFKIGMDDTESCLRDLFLDRKIGDRYQSSDRSLQSFFSDQLETNYVFDISIDAVVPYKYFCFEQFKRYFKIKTNKDMHKKLIEVFSYRNDISQRRSTVEEALKLLLVKHKFNAPNHLILRQQKTILDSIQDNPDYGVYRIQKDFQQRIRQLAEKQVKEVLIIDHIAAQENLTLTNQDVQSYLALTSRPRMKEFIYYELPSFKIQGQEVPIAAEEINRYCLREKAINQIIYYLMKS